MPDNENIVWHQAAITQAERFTRAGVAGATIWMTGLSGSGKSTIANLVARHLFDSGVPVYVLDGDNVRHGLNSDLGFSDIDRTENVRRIGEVAALLADTGLVVLVPVISPYIKDRALARRASEKLGVNFAEVFIDTDISVCQERDPKGLYAKARAGEIANFTGISSPYEAPTDPDLLLDTSAGDANDLARRLINNLSHLWVL